MSENYRNKLAAHNTVLSSYLQIRNIDNKANGNLETVLMYEKPVRLFRKRNNPIPVLKIEKDKEDRWYAAPIDLKKREYNFFY